MKLSKVEVKATPQKAVVQLQFKIFFLKWRGSLFLTNSEKETSKGIKQREAQHNQLDNLNPQDHPQVHPLVSYLYLEVNKPEVYQFNPTFRSEPHPQECSHLVLPLVGHQALLQECLAWSLLAHPQGYRPI